MIWAIVQLSTKETQFFCVMKVIDGGVLPEFPIKEFDLVDIGMSGMYALGPGSNFGVGTFFKTST